MQINGKKLQIKGRSGKMERREKKVRHWSAEERKLTSFVVQ